MKTADFLSLLKPKLKSFPPLPLDLEAQGQKVRRATHSILHNHEVVLVNETRERIYEGYELDPFKREITGVVPIVLEELYVLTMTLTLLMLTNPNYTASREIAESLLQFEEFSSDEVLAVANKIEGLVS